MDAGVPISDPVAGISIGLVKEGGTFTLLTDIMGDEDHYGDMDFKVAGTGRGITGIQLDLKIDGINEEIIQATLEQARDARREILKFMLCTTLRQPRAEISETAPRLLTVQISPEKIGLLIGPGGKTINGIQEETGAKIDIEDNGMVYISHSDSAGAEAAKLRVEALTEEMRVGKVYEGHVTSIKDFGAFVEILPGRDGLCHISELDDKYVGKVEDVCQGWRPHAGEGDRHRRTRPGEAVAQGAAARAEPGQGRRRRWCSAAAGGGSATAATAAAREPPAARGKPPPRSDAREGTAGVKQNPASRGRAPPDSEPQNPAMPPACHVLSEISAMVSSEQYNELAEVAGGFIHDIKNHLSTLGLNLQLLTEDFQSAETPRERCALTKIQKLQNECDRLVEISNDFLRFARINSVEREPCDLTEVVEELIDFFMPTTQRANIDLRGAPARRFAARLPQSRDVRAGLLNLFLNGQQAMPNGGVLTIQVNLETSLAPHRVGWSRPSATTGQTKYQWTPFACTSLTRASVCRRT